MDNTHIIELSVLTVMMVCVFAMPIVQYKIDRKRYKAWKDNLTPSGKYCEECGASTFLEKDIKSYDTKTGKPNIIFHTVCLSEECNTLRLDDGVS